MERERERPLQDEGINTLVSALKSVVAQRRRTDANAKPPLAQDNESTIPLPVHLPSFLPSFLPSAPIDAAAARNRADELTLPRSL